MTMARANADMYFSQATWDEYGPQIKEHAVSAARQRAREVLEDTEVQKWLPTH